MDELVQELTVEMLKDGIWRQIAEVVGIEGLYRLTKKIGGQTVYIPKTETIIRPIRDAHIKAEFNGFNHNMLAKKYDVTERWVRELCGPGIVEGQIGLFDAFGSDS